MTWRPAIKLRLRWCILNNCFTKKYIKIIVLLKNTSKCFKNIKNNNFTKELEGIHQNVFSEVLSSMLDKDRLDTMPFHFEVIFGVCLDILSFEKIKTRFFF